ncbi:hypothetical protein ACFOZ0_22510 [Streptomyces yaanensis]|uniref:Uncharacterized protein n=1 Tax=Streptomyces yaanensis TaxID=1142239 RepID=A0ABV7SGD2_9ACTN|nr:hypothetical protein [Streptomyces sp. CGMCC 4.7035]WNC00998.1 hypothetical protein Q2K21_24725 [Streptomyces sp. CGMCC 4.7035]
MPKQPLIAEPVAPARPGTLRRLLVRYCLRPVMESLTALGAIHVATFWHPQLGTPPCYTAADIEDLRQLYRTSLVPFQTRPEA